MPPIVLSLLQLLLLVLLYAFVYRAVRAVVRDIRGVETVDRRAPAPAAPRARRAPAPRPPRRQRRGPPGELVVHTPEGRPRVLALDGEVTFGRASGATVPLSDPYVSDRHARVYRDGGEWVVDDLGSTNGTFLNQVKVTSPMPLSAGDQLGIGKTVVEVRR